MNNILLTKEQADKVRGRHGQYSALDPIALEDGRFILPIDVLDDKEHAEVLNELLECKSAEIEEVKIINKGVPAGDIEREKITYKTVSISQLTIREEKEAGVLPAEGGKEITTI